MSGNDTRFVLVTDLEAGAVPPRMPPNTAQPSGEVQVADLVVVGEAALTAGRAGWAPLRGGITEVRLDEHGTHPLPVSRPVPASGQPAGAGEGDPGT